MELITELMALSLITLFTTGTLDIGPLPIKTVTNTKK